METENFMVPESGSTAGSEIGCPIEEVDDWAASNAESDCVEVAFGGLRQFQSLDIVQKN